MGTQASIMDDTKRIERVDKYPLKADICYTQNTLLNLTKKITLKIPNYYNQVVRESTELRKNPFRENRDMDSQKCQIPGFKLLTC